MERQRLSEVWTVPNLLTIGRILIVPLFFVFAVYHFRATAPNGNGLWYQVGAIVTFVLILLSDGLDGHIARSTNQVTTLGTIMDPVADKLFVISSFALLAAFRAIPIWLAVAVLSKDLVLSIGWLLLQILGYDSSVKPSKIGKTTIVFQFLVVLEAVVGSPPIAKKILWLVTGVLTFVSTVGYILDGLQRCNEESPEQEPENG